MPVFRLPALALPLALLAACAAAAPAQAFELGFNDESALVSYAGKFGKTPDLTSLDAVATHEREAGATTQRILIAWAEVAAGSSAPQPQTAAADPAWPGYNWAAADRSIRAAVAHGLRPLVWFHSAPSWAEPSNHPSTSNGYRAGTWRPNAKLFKQFTIAVAKRYNGSYPDPDNPGQALPRVSVFQPWNEPNLYVEITPQWTKQGGKTVPASPAIYRRLQNAGYEGIKSVQPDATVLAAGTAPFGGLSSADPRIPPALFWRELLCVTTKRGKLVANPKCAKLKFDGLAHHTYPIGPPTRTARNADDVVVPDMGKLKSILAAGRRAKLLTSKVERNLWVTEMSWETAPDPGGLSLDDYALYMQGAFYTLWKAGVQHVLWWNSRDDAKGSSWEASLQSGIYYRGATPAQDTRKPVWQAFHFPFAAYRVGGVAALWAKPPGTGEVTVQASKNGAWVDVAKLKLRADGVVSGRLRVNPGVQLRAVQGSEISLTWKTF
ncbi:MAG: hypothetical protein QM679_01100 [Patulibacter sp.]